MALNLTWLSAAGQLAYACTVAERLPQTFAALCAGRIHPVYLRIIEEETSILSGEDAARADEILAQAAPGKTFGQVRYTAHRLALKLDPDSARRRKEQAKRDAHVRGFRESPGNAGMVAREMPPDEVLASWQHLEQRAPDLRSAGIPGTLRELRNTEASSGAGGSMPQASRRAAPPATSRTRRRGAVPTGTRRMPR